MHSDTVRGNWLVVLYVTRADADPVELARACAAVDGQVESETAGLFIKLVGNGCYVSPHPAAGKSFAWASVHSIYSQQ